MVGGGGRWWEMVGGGGRWWKMVGGGGRWWEMVGDGGRWWEMVGDPEVPYLCIRILKYCIPGDRNLEELGPGIRLHENTRDYRHMHLC